MSEPDRGIAATSAGAIIGGGGEAQKGSLPDFEIRKQADRGWVIPQNTRSQKNFVDNAAVLGGSLLSA